MIILDNKTRLADLQNEYAQIVTAIAGLTSEQVTTKSYKIDTAQTSQEVTYRDLPRLHTMKDEIWSQIARMSKSKGFLSV